MVHGRVGTNGAGYLLSLLSSDYYIVNLDSIPNKSGGSVCVFSNLHGFILFKKIEATSLVKGKRMTYFFQTRTINLIKVYMSEVREYSIRFH